MIAPEKADASWWRRLTSAWSLAILALVLMAGVIVALFADVFLPAVTWLDEWVYFGLGQDFWHVPLDAYKHSRLTWLLPLALVERILPVVPGLLALQAACLALGAVSVACALRRIVSGHLAIVMAVLTLFAWPVLASGGALYHNAIAGPLVATMIWTLLVAVDRRSWLAWGVAGAVFALTVHSNINTVFMVPSVLVLTGLGLWAVGHLSRGAVGRALAGLGVGALGATVMLGAVSFSLGQDFLFWRTGLQKALDQSSALESWYWPLWSGWLGDATYLILPVVAASAGAVFLALSLIHI